MFTYDTMMCFLIIALCFAVGDIVSEKTKAMISMLFVAVVLFMIGFWTGIIPSDVFDISGLNATAGFLGLSILINMGSLLNAKEFVKEWKTVLLGLSIVVAGGFLMFFLARFLIGNNLAVAIVGPITGGFAAGLVVIDEAGKLGLPSVALLAAIIVATQGAWGYPLGSFFLRKEANRLMKDFRAGAGTATLSAAPELPAETSESKKRKPWQLPSIPEKYSTTYVLIAKIAILSFLAHRMSLITGLSQYICALIVGVIAHEINFIERDICGKAKIYGISILALWANVLSNLTTTTLADVISMIKPVIVAYLVGTLAIFVVGLIIGKILGFSWQMSLTVATTCFYGFPGTFVLTQEIASKVGETEEGENYLTQKLMPTMLISGFTTMTIVSVIIAGVFNGFLIA